MKNSKRLFQVVALCILFSSLAPQKAYAYLDPGSGSLILQLIAAFLVGGLFAIKIFWNKIKLFFASLFSRNKKKEKKS